MIKIGITGGIGSGKSLVADRWRERGIQVFDADAVSRALTAPGGEALPAIREAFGSGVFANDDTLDRKNLAAIVFADEASRIKLNSIIHPMVIQRLNDAFDEAETNGASIAAAEVPLLFEAGMSGAFDRVVLVATSPDKQVERVMARDGISCDDALARTNAQMTLNEKRALADDIIENNGSIAGVFELTDMLIKKYLREARHD